jgi:hypothetical protein
MTARENIGPRAGPGFAGWVIVGLLALSPALWSRLTPNEYAGGRSRDAEARQTRNASAIGIMLGEFRTGFSDILLIKTERYLHSGVGYVPHMDKKVQSTAGEIEALDAHQEEVGEAAGISEEGAEDTPPPALIPAPDRDYRGIIGRLQREVKPWHDPSSHAAHTDGRQMLPWFRIATLSDANHVQAYTMGAYWLGRHDRTESESYLREGLGNNPDAFQLHLMMGFSCFRRARELPGDLFNPSPEQGALLTKARTSFRKAAELALEQRPHDDLDGAGAWGHYEETDAWAAFRMAVLTEKHYGAAGEAAKLARRIIAQAGSEKTLKRLANGDGGP